MVPLARLERARPYEQQILNLSRLPVPPQGHWRSANFQGFPKRVSFAPKCHIVRSLDEQGQNVRSRIFPHTYNMTSQFNCITIVKNHTIKAPLSANSLFFLQTDWEKHVSTPL